MKRTGITEGKLDDNSEGLFIADSWPQRRTAHRDLQRSWTGTISSESVIDLIPGSEPVKSESELDKAEETTSYNKTVEPVISESISIDQIRVRRIGGRLVEVRSIDQVAVDLKTTAGRC